LSASPAYARNCFISESKEQFYRPGKGHSVYKYVCATPDLIPDLQSLQNISENFLIIHFSEIQTFLKYSILALENTEGHAGLPECNKLLLEVSALTFMQI